MSNTEVEHYENGNIKTIVVKDDNGRFHNSSGPAVQKWYENGQEDYRSYCVEGKRHNPSGPATQGWYENGQEQFRAYWMDGKKHNTSGPAFQGWYGDGQEWFREYWIDGRELTEEEFDRRKDTVEIQVEGKTKRVSRMSAKELGLL